MFCSGTYLQAEGHWFKSSSAQRRRPFLKGKGQKRSYRTTGASKNSRKNGKCEQCVSTFRWENKMINGSCSKPYSVFKRNRIYYAQFRLPDGRRSVAKSTGQTSRGAAERWCFEYLKTGNIVRRENVTLAEYSKDFTWEGSWATDNHSHLFFLGYFSVRF